jgi:pentatricopeptide repeat protein
VAESLLEFIKTEASQLNNSDLLPDVYTYSMILNAWATSKLPEASHRMEAILADMRKKKLPLTSVPYNILLRFYGGMGEIEKVKDIIDTMGNDGVKPDLASLLSALYCNAKVGQTQKAEDILQRMIDERTFGNDYDDNAIGQSVQHILLAYREVVTSGSLSDKKKEHALECAETLLQKVNRSGILNAQSYGEFRVSPVLSF